MIDKIKNFFGGIVRKFRPTFTISHKLTVKSGAGLSALGCTAGIVIEGYKGDLTMKKALFLGGGAVAFGSAYHYLDNKEHKQVVDEYKHKERLAKIQHPRAAALTTKVEGVDAEEKEVEDDEATGALGEAETMAEGKTIYILHLPFILQQILLFCPLTYFVAMLTLLLSMFGALCFSRVRADYFDESVVEPTIFVAIEGDTGSGKSKFREIFHKLFSRVIQLDKEKINKEEDDKRNIIQTVGVRTTMAKFLKLLVNNCGVHMFDFESEVESVVSAIKSKNNYIDYEIIRLAFDNDDLARMTNNLQIKSKIHVNYSFTGTNGGFEKFINKDEVEGGSASRFCWCNIPPLSEGGPLEMDLPKEFEMEKIRDDIDEYRSKYCYVTDADGNDVPCPETKVDISYLFAPLKKWNDQQQKMCEKDKSYCCYLRFANIAFRCGMILHMLYGCPGPEQEKERQNIINVVLYLADYYMSSYVKKFGKVDNKVADHSAQQQVYITDTRALKALHDMKDEKGQSMYGWDNLEKISGIPASTIRSRVNKLEEDSKDNKEK